MSWLDEPIRIIQIRLPKEARKTWRVLNGGNPDLYSVHVGLSRPVNEYERKELAEFHIDTDEENRYFAVISETTLEFVRDGIDKYHAVFDSAVEKARQVGSSAWANRGGSRRSRTTR
jgi:hypothetical protein